MYRQILSLLSSFILFCACSTMGFLQEIPDGPYLGQKPPGLEPEIFAPGIVSQEKRFEQHACFSPDNKELVFAVTNSGWSSSRIWMSTSTGGKWTKPEEISFIGSYDGWSPHYSLDGKQFFFTSPGTDYPPTNIYQCQRTADGWTKPDKIPSPVSSGSDEWGFSLAEDGSMYLCSHRKQGSPGGCDIYYAKFVNGQYTSAQPINALNTSSNDCAPHIDGKQRYIIFNSKRSGGKGDMDLYISFHKDDDSWTEPVSLGDTINTSASEYGAFISPDDKYLFFTRRTSSNSDIYWVDINAVEVLRPDNSIKY